ncbi:MAG: SRPBCC domain-containing protein [Ignavibacteriales bacterium]|nr:MAG: SRPBCC domain-containing protein [Ignavibacteriales bacterium]
MDFSVDMHKKKITVKREFSLPLSQIWDAWTKRELQDQWWAPNPWKAKTKSLEFGEGGSWIYAMVGPEGQKQWARADFEKINPLKSFSGLDAFCDENGNINDSLPVSKWSVHFSEKKNTTLVSIEIKYAELNDLETIINMGFKEGFTAALENLDRIIERDFSLAI